MYLRAQKSSHSNAHGFLKVTEVSWHSRNLGNNQPDSMGVLTMRSLLLRWHPAVISFLSVWIIQVVLTALTEIDCQRKGQFERTHTEKSTFLTPLEFSPRQQERISKEPELNSSKLRREDLVLTDVNTQNYRTVRMSAGMRCLLQNYAFHEIYNVKHKVALF